MWEECCIARAVHLRALGLPRKISRLHPQKVNTILARAASKLSDWCGRLGAGLGAVSRVGRRGELDPPWPIEVFVSDRVLTMAADRHRREAAS